MIRFYCSFELNFATNNLQTENNNNKFRVEQNSLNSTKMPPNATNEVTGVLNEDDAETFDGGLSKDITPLKKAEKRMLKLVWRNIILFGYLHLAALYGAWLCLTSAKWLTVFFGMLCVWKTMLKYFKFLFSF